MSAPACANSRTTLPHTISATGSSVRPPSSCPATFRWAITGCTFRRARPKPSTPLIVVPAKLELPPRLGAKRTWGLATQLYSVQSKDLGASAI